MNIKNTRH